VRPIKPSVLIGFSADLDRDNGVGRREILGLDIGPSEAETFWTDFLRKLARRGLRGVKPVISDAPEDLRTAIRQDA
jgi:transposase-like protein